MINAALLDTPDRQLRRASAIYEFANEGILLTTPDGVIFDVNASFVRITGYTLDDVRGKRPSVLQSGRQGPDFYQAMWNATRVHGHWRGEIWNRRKSGEIFVELLTICAVKDPSGQLECYVGIFSDITAQREEFQLLANLAYHDALTGLPNRRLLMERIGQAIAQGKRHQISLAVVYIDLDGFKKVNDENGHAAGDELLVEVAARMRECLRAEDTLGRMGGDEFVALLQNVKDETDCAPLLTRLREACAIPFEVQGKRMHISASIGIAVSRTGDANDAETLLQRADQAMYLAKQAGKNCYRFFRDKPAHRELQHNC